MGEGELVLYLNIQSLVKSELPSTVLLATKLQYFIELWLSNHT